LNTEFFIARKIIKGDSSQSRLSKPIVIISLASIIIGVAIMIISVSVVTGFQQGIRNKVIGFGAHIQVTNLFDNSSMESSSIPIDQDFYPSIAETEEGVKHIQIFAYKPAILQSKQDSVAFNNSKVDTSTSTQDILGVLFKGVDQDYNWQFFNDKLIKGRTVSYANRNNEVLISKYVSDKMGYAVGDEIDAYFIMDNGPKKRKFNICGIYDTGMEEFDKKFIFTQIDHIQRLNNWGVKTLLTVDKDTCIDGKFILRGLTNGGTGAYRYKWNYSDYFNEKDYLLLNGQLTEDIRLVSTDYEVEIFGLSKEPKSVPDTSWAKIKVTSPCECNEETLALAPVIFNSDSSITMPFGTIEIRQGKGTQNLYTGGFEILLEDWNELENMDEIIDFNIPGQLATKTIKELQPSIFSWLNIIDYNIVIIICLMLIVSLINMTTTLLVMILDKSNMIGILKAIGATNRKIRKIFMLNSIFLLSRGLFWGNLLGIGLISIQYFTGVLSLNAEVYYLDAVPVNFNLWHILLINLLVIVVCRLTLVIPSLLITRIDPIKAIRFD
jgi:lipoprotein-releasing system permease protein